MVKVENSMIKGENNMLKNKIGMAFGLKRLLDEGPGVLFDLGMECVQLQSFDATLFTKENAEKVKELLGDKIEVSSIWAGWSGPSVWDFKEGPVTLGLVPEAYRFIRMKEIMQGVDFAEWLGVENVATHVGFIPESPYTPEYMGLVAAVKKLVEYCENKKIYFNFETGQETPITLMRAITDLNSDYVGINFDPANLIAYGKGNPIDAIDIFKDRIRGIHVKDADYPTKFYELGAERVVGEGTVNYPVFLPKLIKQGYKGDLYIEREIEGDQQIIDIKKTIVYVKDLIAKIEA